MFWLYFQINSCFGQDLYFPKVLVFMVGSPGCFWGLNIKIEVPGAYLHYKEIFDIRTINIGSGVQACPQSTEYNVIQCSVDWAAFKRNRMFLPLFLSNAAHLKKIYIFINILNRLVDFINSLTKSLVQYF